jgi:hypothetical protein
VLACTYCSRELNDEERESPQFDADGDALCDECYDEHFRDYCGRCDERVDTSDLDTSPGQLIGIWNTAPASVGDLAPGYYRIKRRPFFVDWMVGGHFYSDALEFVSKLDEQGETQAKEAMHFAGPLCSKCRASLANVGGQP